MLRGTAFGVGLLLAVTTTSAAFTTRPRREAHPSVAHSGLYSPSEDSLSMKCARLFAIGSVTLMSKVLMEWMNTTQVERAELFHALVRERNGRGMISVANHTSVFDDPVLQAAIVGFVDPGLHRWGVCKEHICFGNELSAAFTGAGKVLPVRVGEGVEQIMFKAVGRRLAEGKWVHIFPEAACIQSGKLGRGQSKGCREEAKAEKVGLLKWGVGKLVMHVAFGPESLPPIIMPYYHVGMDKIKPLDENSQSTNPWYVLGRINNKVRVKFGDPIDVSDLITEYEKKRGSKRRLVEIDPETNKFLNWDGSDELERELYSKITKRVEMALLVLEKEFEQEGVVKQ